MEEERGQGMGVRLGRNDECGMGRLDCEGVVVLGSWVGIDPALSITCCGISVLSFGMRWYESKIISKGKLNKANLGVHIP